MNVDMEIKMNLTQKEMKRDENDVNVNDMNVNIEVGKELNFK